MGGFEHYVGDAKQIDPGQRISVIVPFKTFKNSKKKITPS